MGGRRTVALWVVLLSIMLAAPAQGQIINAGRGVVGGVAIDPSGTISNRTAAPEELAQMQARLKLTAAQQANASTLKCVSLPKLFAQAKDLLAAGKPLPDDIKYLGGLTQIQYIFTYQDQKDLLIAGPAEEWIGADTLEPVGKVSGRPVLQFYDLVAAWRTVNQQATGDFFGCSIDPPENVKDLSDQIAKDYSNRRGELVAAMTKAIGPQKVRIIGTADNTRLALALVAADYKLKRFTMGLENTPVSGLGTAIDPTEGNGCRFWFVPQYEPLQVSADQNAYALRGPRLEVKASAQTLTFNSAGATPKAKAFADKFSAKLPELVKVEPALADLQNIADLAVLAELVRHDKLEAKVQWDASWILDAKACPLPVLPVPRTADTLVVVPGNAVASGGVSFSMRALVRNDARAAAKAGDIPTTPALPTGGAWQAPLTPASAAVPVASPGDRP